MPLRRQKEGFRLAWTLLFFYIVLVAQAQEMPTTLRKWTVEDGLLDHKITSLLKGQTGFLWIGTAYGLNRFDGNEFIQVDLEEGESDLRKIIYILEDQKGKVWVLSKTGGEPALHQIDPLTLQVKLLGAEDFPLPFVPDEDLQFFNTPDKVLWIVKENKEIYQFQGQSFELFYSHPASDPIIQVYSHIQDRFWIRTHEEILELDEKGQVLTRMDSPNPYTSTFGGKLAADQLLWSTNTGEKITQLSLLNSGEAEPVPTSFAHIFEGMPDPLPKKRIQQQNLYSGAMWLVDNGKMCIYHLDSAPLEFDLGIPSEGLLGDAPFLMTSASSAWLSLTDGLYYFEYTPSPFQTYLTRSASEKPQSLREIVVGEAGEIFVNGYQGIWHIAPPNDQVTPHLTPAEQAALCTQHPDFFGGEWLVEGSGWNAVGKCTS